MNMIQNDESINTPKLDSHYYLFIGDILFITLQLWCCFMSDDGVWLHVKHLLFQFLLHLCFVVILYSRCVLAPPTV